MSTGFLVQLVIVNVAVVAAIVYLVRKAARTARKRDAGCDCCSAARQERR